MAFARHCQGTWGASRVVLGRTVGAEPSGSLLHHHWVLFLQLASQPLALGVIHLIKLITVETAN